VTAGAKQAGTYGMQAAISGGKSSYAMDNSPANESSYRARFYFHPNNVTISTTAQDIFVGVNASSQVAFRVQLRRSSGNYQISATVTRSGGSTSTSWYTISNAYHAIEISWQAATSASFSLYVDGTLKTTLTKLNTSNYKVESVYLGPSAGLSGVQGTEYFDSFVARRSAYIGP
jgi:hypothetical protein